MEKSAPVDLLQPMLKGNGWIGDKPEDLAADVLGRVYMITDNDGVNDAFGETQFIRLGKVSDLFR